MSPLQIGKIAAWLASITGLHKVSAPQLHSLLHKAPGQELHFGQSIFKSGETADYFYIVVAGGVQLVDIKDKETDDGK